MGCAAPEEGMAARLSADPSDFWARSSLASGSPFSESGEALLAPASSQQPEKARPLHRVWCDTTSSTSPIPPLIS